VCGILGNKRDIYASRMVILHDNPESWKLDKLSYTAQCA